MKAISPVIATVIIVSVAIAISIAVALWLTGITSGFTQTENLQIVSAYAQGNANNGWALTLSIKNTGTTTASITNVFINGRPYSSVTGVTVYVAVGTTNQTLSQWGGSVPVKPGENATVTIIIAPQSTSGFTDGQMVNVKVHTASGRDYPATVTLP